MLEKLLATAQEEIEPLIIGEEEFSYEDSSQFVEEKQGSIIAELLKKNRLGFYGSNN